MTPRVVILSAPSGGGKTTITRSLLQRRTDLGFSVSATTRPPRDGEVDGVAYRFVPRPEFERWVAAGDFLEWAEYAGNLYGTLKSEVERVQRAGQHVLLDIEVQGARQVLRGCPPPRSISIFVLPPSGREWIDRLQGRHTETSASLVQRLDQAVLEIRQSVGWQHIVINDDVERVVEEISAIIDADGLPRHAPPPARLSSLVDELVAEADRLRHD